MHRWNGASKNDRERGAVLVEAAMILPLIMLIVLGIIEFALAYKDSLTVSAATRTGARTASALPRQSTFASSAAAAVATALNALPADSPQELWIYKAGTNGYPEGHSSFDDCAADACQKFLWAPSARRWKDSPEPGYNWDYTSQDACGGTGSDVLGVYLKVRHKFVTGLFGSAKTLTDHTVMRLEPIPVVIGCKQGSG